VFSLRGRAAVLCAAAASLTALTLPAPASAGESTGPNVAWTSPATEAVLKGVVPWSACRVNATDASGVASVEFSVVGGAKLGRQSGAPYECTWDTRTVADGRYTLEARAVDRLGNATVARRTVYVGNKSNPVPTSPTAPVSTAPAAPVADAPAATTPAPSGCATFPSQLGTKQPSEAGGSVAGAFVDSRGCTIKLQGFNTFPVWTLEHYRGIKAKGFNALRLILPWRDYEPSAGRFAKLDQLDYQISLAKRAGLYVILDNHVDNWNTPPSWATGSDQVDQVQRHAKRFVQELARRYANEPAVAAIDLVNEPKSNDQARILRLYDTMISWVRAIDRDKIVMTSPGHGNSDMSKADASLQRQRHNVVYTYHDYYAGNGNAGTTSVGYNQWGLGSGLWTWNGTTGYKTTGDQADLAAQLALQVAYARRADLPMWIGEWAINPTVTNASAWVDQKVALYEKYGLGRAWWLYTCQEGLAIRSGGSSCGWKTIVDRLN
jgi:Cellulase (glycosyl hydrolase family 5)/Bacterial Ig domain